MLKESLEQTTFRFDVWMQYLKATKRKQPNKQPKIRRTVKNRRAIAPQNKAHAPIKYWYKDNHDKIVEQN